MNLMERVSFESEYGYEDCEFKLLCGLSVTSVNMLFFDIEKMPGTAGVKSSGA